MLNYLDFVMPKVMAIYIFTLAENKNPKVSQGIEPWTLFRFHIGGQNDSMVCR